MTADRTHSNARAPKMNELKKTSVYVGVALLLLGIALLANRPAGGTGGDYNDQGKKFFPELTRPEQATTLEVVEFDPTTAAPMQFQVALRNGRWIIPSHYDYPADARDRLARTAAGVIDLARDTIRGDRPEDHRAMGVRDPKDPKATSAEGLGKRVTIKDKTDKVLADLIIGKTVAGQPDQRYVRLPGQNRVYGVKLDNVDLSTRFSDWIETNLLKLDRSTVRSIVFDNHKVDETRGTLSLGEVLTVTKRDTAELPPGTPAWSLDKVPPGKEVNASALDTLTLTLGDLRIVGIRPKPLGLSEELKAEEGKTKLDAEAVQSLMSKGFYLYQGRLVSNEGNVIVTCSDGVIYTLRFGKVTFARGEALSAGTDNEKGESPAPKKEGESAQDDAIESRFLFVTAQFDPDVISKPKPRVSGELPDDVFARSKAERDQLNKKAEEDAKREQTEYEKKLEDGKKRAKELTDRFAGWYYVVPGDAFRKVVLDRDALTRAPSPPGMNSGQPSGLPNFPGGFGDRPGGVPRSPFEQ